MTHNLPLFDYAESERRKVEGMELAANNRGGILTEARVIAKELATEGRAISADDVVAAMCERGYGIHALKNAAGSLFAGQDWQWTGQFVKSVRSHSHSNLLRLWRLAK